MPFRLKITIFLSLGSQLSYETLCFKIHKKCAPEVHLKTFENLEKARQ